MFPLLPTHCHQPNWSTGDNRVLGRPSLERRAACRRRSKRRRRSLGKVGEKEEEERVRRILENVQEKKEVKEVERVRRNLGKVQEKKEVRVGRKEEEADGDGPPVLVSAPLTLKVEVRKRISAIEEIFVAKMMF